MHDIDQPISIDLLRIKQYMEASRSFKQSLLRSMLFGLKLESSTALLKNTTLLERKKSIKLTVDVATAIARGAGAHWSRAVLIANLSREEENNKVLLLLLMRTQKLRQTILNINATRKLNNNYNVSKSKKIVTRARDQRVKKARAGLRSHDRTPASCIVKRMVKKRTRVLKSLIPGACSLKQNHQYSLLLEALDYVVSLRAQVDVMRRITDSLVPLTSPPTVACSCFTRKKGMEQNF